MFILGVLGWFCRCRLVCWLHVQTP